MKKLWRYIHRWLVLFGIDLRKLIHCIRELPAYWRDLKTFKKQIRSKQNNFPFGSLYPCFGDRLAGSGSAQGHYFHQDLLVARRIYLNHPNIHVDVGSRVDGFVAHVAAFRAIQVIDIRPLSIQVPNITFIQADFMKPVEDRLFKYCDSLSCLHAMEHFGLGRYGDPINDDGHLFGLNNLHCILQKGGKLYFSVPIGPQRVEFNAHRVFSIRYLLEYFASKYCIDYFSFVDDQGNLHENVPIKEDDIQNNFGCIYGCGIFEMTKL